MMKKYVLLILLLLPFISVNAYEIVSGDMDTVGSVVKIGEDEFYVLGKDEDAHKTYYKLLSKYNLGAGIGYSTATDRQDPTATGWTQTGSGPFKGSVAFASNCYWYNEYPLEFEYIYGEGSNIYSHIENYVAYLKTLDTESKISGRLMSKTDLEDAVNKGNRLDGGHLTDTASDIAGKEWIYSVSYWLGTAHGNEQIWMIASESNATTWAYGVDVVWGIRPLIVIEEDKPQEPVVEPTNNGEVKGIEEVKKNPKTGIINYSIILIVLINVMMFIYFKVYKKRYFSKKIC